MNKLRYICLEGGGGRGTVYLGVVKALNDKGILPVPRISLNPERTLGSINGDPKELRKGHQILGVSGASAGAIT